jgi:hypothetical protein
VRVLDEFEAVSAHRIVGADGGGRRVMRKRTHAEISLIWLNRVSVTSRAKCMQKAKKQAIHVHSLCIKWIIYA